MLVPRFGKRSAFDDMLVPRFGKRSAFDDMLVPRFGKRRAFDDILVPRFGKRASHVDDLLTPRFGKRFLYSPRRVTSLFSNYGESPFERYNDFSMAFLPYQNDYVYPHYYLNAAAAAEAVRDFEPDEEPSAAAIKAGEGEKE
eukprot:TRINITY_DN7181_c0_g1_i3.p1 TRINITY_DN7181_c0_g1~~TRINITY_DN7181_c0_g1_i3.p1  ORF type:complete len:142 (-),score=32.46 TRINITY_DN7181_c0_g1_i3:377-802(-)